MARKGMTGQLNMFDFFQSLDENASGEVEMVSLMPSFEEEETELVEEPAPVEETEPVEEPVPVEEPATLDEEIQPRDSAVMSRCYEVDGEKFEIAYLNYNKVRIIRGKDAPVIKEFASSKEAVDYYVQQMQEMDTKE